MQTRNKLTISTPGEREIAMTRVFDAPRHLVWKAMTTPALIRRWLFGPPGWEMTVCEDDARTGGAFRWAWRGPDGQEMSMHGTYREVVPPIAGGAGGTMVRTETFDAGCDTQIGEQLATLRLTEQGGLPSIGTGPREPLAAGAAARTLLTVSILYPNRESRDGTIKSGMEHGVTASYDRLEDLLAESAKA